MPLQVIFAYGRQELRTDADALPFGHYHEPRGPICSSSKLRCNGQMRDRLSIDESDKIFGSNRSRQV